MRKLATSSRSAATQAAIDAAGGVEALARKLGISSASVSTWKDIPPRRVLDVAELTHLRPEQLRPDLYRPTAVEPRRSTRNAVRGCSDPRLASEARTLNLDPDAIASRALSDAIRAEKSRRWQEENREAIAAHNRYVEENGLPLAKYRIF
jgi:antitoxin CcdA